MRTNADLTRGHFEIMDALDGDIQGRRDARACMLSPKPIGRPAV